MWTVKSWLLCAMVAAGVPGPAQVSDGDAEAKWAVGVADDFWKAFLGGEEEQAAALLSPELATALTTAPGADAPWRSLQNTPKGRLYQMALRDSLGLELSVATDAVTTAPDRSEVVLKGRLVGKNRDGRAVSLNYTMRVAREGSGGKWGVRYLLITERKGSDKRP